MKSSLTTVTKKILTGLLLVIMILVLTLSIISKFYPNSLPQIANYKLLIVLSGSMSPTFDAGDAIVVSSKSNSKQYKKGDIITFKQPVNEKMIVTHRVVDVIEDGTKLSYKTKGDANNNADLALVPPENIIGLEKFHIPLIGRFIEFSRTKQGSLFLVIIPGLILIISELNSIRKIVSRKQGLKKKQEEQIRIE